jgi:hypothetical protein
MGQVHSTGTAAPAMLAAVNTLSPIARVGTPGCQIGYMDYRLVCWVSSFERCFVTQNNAMKSANPTHRANHVAGEGQRVGSLRRGGSVLVRSPT